MEQVDFKKMKKKEERIFVKLSPFEKEELKQFCTKHEITISDLVRYGITKVMDEKKAK